MNTNLNLVKEILNISFRKLCFLYNLPYKKSTFEELINNQNLINNLNKNIQKNKIFRTREFNSIYQFYVYRNLLYYFIRETKPEIIIETGVLHGLTTSWILQAINDNKFGKLISIDLPRRDWNFYMGSRPFGPGSETEEKELEDQNPGWIIPKYLKNNWELVLGPSEVKLEKVCKDIEKVDLFIHDSDHSYKTMKYECDFVVNKYPNADIIIDDFNLNNYTYELLSGNLYSGILIDDVDPNGNIFPSTAFLKRSKKST
mgnify:CR=1 FL=1